MKLRFASLAAALLLGGCHAKSRAEPAPHRAGPALSIAGTGDVWGQVEPCG